ncbi:MAG: hypothetical protein ACRYGC_07700 [Janthinobacterium lividum]
MRHSAARPAWLIAAALLAATQLPATSRAQPAVSQADPAAEAPADAAGDTVRPTPDGGPASRSDANDTAAPGPPGQEPTPAPPGPPPGPPQAPARPRADAAARIGHFRVYEHPPCHADPCQATVGDLDSHRGFEATVSLGPMHLAPQLEESARSGQIDLLLSGELHHGPRGATLRALHLEGVTPHAPAPPRAGHAGAAPGPARSRPPAAPGPRLLRA